MKATKVELTGKERAIVWAVMAWFNRNNVGTDTLMSKLYFKDVHKIAEKYDAKIYDIMIDIGQWLQKRRDEGKL